MSCDHIIDDLEAVGIDLIEVVFYAKIHPQIGHNLADCLTTSVRTNSHLGSRLPLRTVSASLASLRSSLTSSSLRMNDSQVVVHDAVETIHNNYSRVVGGCR